MTLNRGSSHAHAHDKSLQRLLTGREISVVSGVACQRQYRAVNELRIVTRQQRDYSPEEGAGGDQKRK